MKPLLALLTLPFLAALALALDDKEIRPNDVIYRKDGTQLVGYVHWVDSSECQVAGFDKVRLFPTMLAGLGPRSALKVLFWLSTWERHDPRASHVHLGPIGVTPGAQGQGIGSRLMTRYCEALATAGEPGYLETDRPENVVFYRRFGFETTEEIRVLGVRNYLMSTAKPTLT